MDLLCIIFVCFVGARSQVDFCIRVIGLPHLAILQYHTSSRGKQAKAAGEDGKAHVRARDCRSPATKAGCDDEGRAQESSPYCE